MLQAPTSAILLAIASAATQAQDYDTAMTAAKPCAVQFPQDAADIVADIVEGLSSSGSTVTLAAKGMPVLQKAGHHTEVVKVHHMPLYTGYVPVFGSQCVHMHIDKPSSALST